MRFFWTIEWLSSKDQKRNDNIMAELDVFCVDTRRRKKAAMDGARLQKGPCSLPVNRYVDYTVGRRSEDRL